MSGHSDPDRLRISTVDVDGKRYHVSVQITHDGIEHIGRLWFAEEGGDTAIPDRGPLSGRTKEELLLHARRISAPELTQRYRRAFAEKRRFLALRQATEEILAKIRYLNQLAITMRAGLLDVEGAASEIELTERQLHDIIDTLRGLAGVEE